MADIETVVNGLNDIGGFIAGRVGIEQARNFLRTIDDALAMLKTSNLYKCPNCGTWVSAENVVRCKDCMHYDGDEYSGLGTCLENGVCSKPDWFCADGKRNEGR